MGKNLKTLSIALAVLLVAAIIWGSVQTSKCGEADKRLAQEQSAKEELSQKAASLEQMLSEKEEAAAALESEKAALESEKAALTEQGEALAAQIEELRSVTEADIEAKVEARYPQLVEEIARLKAQSAAQLGETLLEEETDAANEG